jgi:DNA-binding response OmpR family regulator
MLTAVDFDLNKALALQLGACAYLTKPVEKAELLKTISRSVHA